MVYTNPVVEMSDWRTIDILWVIFIELIILVDVLIIVRCCGRFRHLMSNHEFLVAALGAGDLFVCYVIVSSGVIILHGGAKVSACGVWRSVEGRYLTLLPIYDAVGVFVLSGYFWIFRGFKVSKDHITSVLVFTAPWLFGFTFVATMALHGVSTTYCGTYATSEDSSEWVKDSIPYLASVLLPAVCSLFIVVCIMVHKRNQKPGAAKDQCETRSDSVRPEECSSYCICNLKQPVVISHNNTLKIHEDSIGFPSKAINNGCNMKCMTYQDVDTSKAHTEQTALSSDDDITFQSTALPMSAYSHSQRSIQAQLLMCLTCSKSATLSKDPNSSTIDMKSTAEINPLASTTGAIEPIVNSGVSTVHRGVSISVLVYANCVIAAPVVMFNLHQAAGHFHVLPEMLDFQSVAFMRELCFWVFYLKTVLTPALWVVYINS